MSKSAAMDGGPGRSEAEAQQRCGQSDDAAFMDEGTKKENPEGEPSGWNPAMPEEESCASFSGGCPRWPASPVAVTPCGDSTYARKLMQYLILSQVKF